MGSTQTFGGEQQNANPVAGGTYEDLIWVKELDASGKEVAKLPTVEGMDGVYFDPGLKRIYVSGGRDNDAGYVRVYQQKDADHYESIGRIPTKAGAGTSFWSPELNRFYVAAPAGGNEEASILVFEPEF